MATLVAEYSLEEGCEVYLRNLALCIEKTHGLVVGGSIQVAEKLIFVEERLVELQLRMQIWKSDCLVSENGLSVSLGDKHDEQSNRLRRLLSRSFQKQNDQVERITLRVDEISKETRSIRQSSAKERYSAEVFALMSKVSLIVFNIQ